jgi:hypothetical protein
MKRIALALGLVVSLVPSMALAELKEVRQKVFGMD